MCNSQRSPTQCIPPPNIADKMKDSKKFDTEQSLANELRNFRFRNDCKFFSALPDAYQKSLAIKWVKIAKPKPVIEVYTIAKG